MDLQSVSRGRVAVALVGLQIAITVAVLCNAISIVHQRLARSARPSGTDEANILVFQNQWIESPSDLAARVRTDLAALRSLEGVVDASVINTFPLSNNGSTDAIRLHPDQLSATAGMAFYFADDHTVNTLGLRLTAGRNFRPTEIQDLTPQDSRRSPPVAIITDALAAHLFPHGSAIGNYVYTGSGLAGPTQVIGTVAALQVPWTRPGGWGNFFYGNTILTPFLYVSQDSYYLVRTKHGQSTVSNAARGALARGSSERVITDLGTLADARNTAYRNDRGIAIMLIFVCIALSAVTGCSLFSVTSRWVSQQRREIGIRRALGATRSNILARLQLTGLTISLAGAAVGSLLAATLSIWLTVHYEVARLSIDYIAYGVAAIVFVCQCAILQPAVRAALLPPALVARSL